MRPGIPVLGATGDVIAVSRAHGVDVAFFAGGSTVSAQNMRATSWELDHAGIDMVLAPAMTDISLERVRVRPVGGMPLVHVNPPTWASASR